ncbi:MAG: hypothetical protein RSD23_01840 [Ruthenibacterium sp.]
MNAIQLATSYVPILDEIYQNASLTAKLDGNPELVKQGANAHELIIPMLSMQGLGEYNKNDGYVKGDVTLTNETVVANFDRGRMFSVDNVDNAETAGIAFGRLAGEFIRAKVVPEEDAFRFATYASKTGATKVSAVLTTGDAIIAALRAGMTAMDEAQVPPENRHLFITPTLLGLVEDMDTTKSKAVLMSFASVTKVPQARFYTAIEQLDGITAGEEAGGYKKAAAAKDLNFEILDKTALIQFPKHIKPKVVDPAMNQNADAWKFGYRQVAVADVYDNKTAGIYVHHKV